MTESELLALAEVELHYIDKDFESLTDENLKDAKTRLNFLAEMIAEYLEGGNENV